MKTYYSAEDIENFADRRQREICIDENIVLTDLAKQTAQMLGIHITVKSSGASGDAFKTVRPQSVGKKQGFSGKICRYFASRHFQNGRSEIKQ